MFQLLSTVVGASMILSSTNAEPLKKMNFINSKHSSLKMVLDNELIKQEIQDLKIIHKTENNLKIDQLKFINE